VATSVFDVLSPEKRTELMQYATPNGGSESFPHLGDKTVRNKFQAQTWGEFIEAEPDSEEFAIEDIMPAQGLAVLGGRGKEAKSTLIIHVARAIANGTAFLHKPTMKRSVLYLNYEMPHGYLKKLLRVGGEPPANAHVLNRPEPLLQLETVDYLFQTLVPAGVIIIDSFRGAFRLQSDGENSAGGAGVILRGLQDIALKHKGLVIVIHHRNKSQGRDGADSFSGTSDWIAAPDMLWTWSRPEKDKPGTLTIEGRMAPVDPMSVMVSLEECNYMGAVAETKERADKDSILNVLTDDGQTADAIAQAAGLPPGTSRARLESLFKESAVNRDGEGKRGNPFLWSKINSAGNYPLGAETNSNGSAAGDADGFNWQTGEQEDRSPEAAGKFEDIPR
jgi:AAA domain